MRANDPETQPDYTIQPHQCMLRAMPCTCCDAILQCAVQRLRRHHQYLTQVCALPVPPALQRLIRCGLVTASSMAASCAAAIRSCLVVETQSAELPSAHSTPHRLACSLCRCSFWSQTATHHGLQHTSLLTRSTADHGSMTCVPAQRSRWPCRPACAQTLSAPGWPAPRSSSPR